MVLACQQELLLMCQDGAHRLALDGIAYLEARSNYTCFHFSNGGNLVSAKTLKDCMRQLPAEFFCRVHHSFAVNRTHVIAVGAGSVALANGKRIGIARRRRKQVHSLLACPVEEAGLAGDSGA